MSFPKTIILCESYFYFWKTFTIYHCNHNGIIETYSKPIIIETHYDDAPVYINGSDKFTATHFILRDNGIWKLYSVRNSCSITVLNADAWPILKIMKRC